MPSVGAGGTTTHADRLGAVRDDGSAQLRHEEASSCQDARGPGLAGTAPMATFTAPRARVCAFVLNALVVAGCAADAQPTNDVDEAEYTSASARLLDFSFEGEVTADGVDPERAIREQLQFSVGQLNGDVGVGRLDKIALTDVRVTRSGGLDLIKYRAKLPVSLSKTTRVGSTYTLKMPRRADEIGQKQFFEKYGATCSDPFAHGNEPGIFWYYYRPKESACTVDAADLVSLRATVKVSAENATDTYPEYDRIWADGVLDIVSIFGKYEDGATTVNDIGVWSHGEFVEATRKALPRPKTTPSNATARPGIESPDVTIESTFPDGRRVRVTSFLIDNIREGGPAFEARYNLLSADADVIAYNGHSGLGQNVRALAQMGKFKAGKYQIVYMNGCDTFAYVDGSLAEIRARLNPSDRKGSKFMEIITNSMPPRWEALPHNTSALLDALVQRDAPKSYLEIMGTFDQSGFVAVTGDEDNTFRPSR